MSVWMNDNRVLIGLALQLFAAFFAAGMLWARMRALEKAVMNGITARQDRHEDYIDELKTARAVTEARCASRKDWIIGIESNVKELTKQGS